MYLTINEFGDINLYRNFYPEWLDIVANGILYVFRIENSIVSELTADGEWEALKVED